MTTTRFQSEARADGPASAPKVHVVTFGCQMNKYDSLLAEGRFRRRGYVTTESMDDADVVLFNTCSVREHAEERTYSWLGEIKRAKQRRPELVIGVMGCMAQRVEEEVFRRAGHVDLVVGTREFQRLPELVDELRARRADPERFAPKERRILAVDGGVDVEVDRSDEEYTGGRHGYLAVMRGCDLNCTYCIVPTTRGRVRSRPIEALVEEARWMVAQGCQVITLLGQTVNSYGEDFPAPAEGEPRFLGRQGRPSLADLLRALQALEGLERIRLITLHPAYLTRALAEALRDCPKVDRFLPLPAQAGSDRVLKAMKRGYTKDLYRERMAMLRELVPDVELGSDWIVGFPTETDAEFDESLAFLDEMDFVVNYVFKYDPRPGTSSADGLADDVSTEQKKARNQALLAMAERVGLRRMSSYVGREVEVFVEEPSPRAEGMLVGRSVHGLPVSLPGGLELCGRTLRVRVQEATAYGMSGTPVEPAARA
ncbi:MAG: tRNA (N6-isopentenyl adenosine(37)-C2)-methylthiotransferase MiaB [Planctomycetes bacterium]|nr:tRNA (N6-isopentenyl adenosine(37)-C2)-methylthiotransferase MiaB [Planctomycetota bacterium]